MKYAFSFSECQMDKGNPNIGHLSLNSGCQTVKFDTNFYFIYLA